LLYISIIRPLPTSTLFPYTTLFRSELCKTIRAKSQIPIIVLSVKGEDQIKVEALDAGADDYVTKPFSMDELLARTRAALRRASAAKDSAPDLIAIGDFRIDLQARSVCVKE